MLSTTPTEIAGGFSGQLKNSGEHLRFEVADTTVIADFTYGDDNPWPKGADGGGYSLVFSGLDPDSPLRLADKQHSGRHARK